MTTPLIVAGLALGGYLLGSIPFGLLVGKWHGIDITAAGSGNIGATNVGRLIGRKWGVAVFALDMLKGLLPTLLAGMVFDEFRMAGALSPAAAMLCWLLVGLAAILGHNHSLLLRFRGGRGISTSLGACLGVYPHLTVPALAALATWGIVVRFTRYISLGSVTACAAFPFFVSFWSIRRGRRLLGDDWPVLAFALLTAISAFYRHRANLRRLAAGTEPRIGSRPATRDAAAR